jgi:uncharacterized Tic20 family protein
MAEEHPFPEEPAEESSQSPPSESEQAQEPEAGQETGFGEEVGSEAQVWSEAESGEAPESDQEAAAGEEETSEEEAESAVEAEEQVEAEQPAEEEMVSEIQAQEEAEKKSAPPPPVARREPLSPSDERTWAMLAHLSVLVNLITGFLGPLAALVIYLVFKDRSRYVAYQSMQSFVFQLVFWVGGGALIGLMWAITGILSAVIIGILCIPFALLGTLVFGALPLVALIYGPIGAIETSQGRDFKYWLIGDWVRDTLTEAF